jgi:hypothetical protein
MSVINRTHEFYFKTIKTYNQAPAWQKDIMLRGSLLQLCNEAEPVSVRHRLRRFWIQQAAKQGPKVEELKNWV